MQKEFFVFGGMLPAGVVFYSGGWAAHIFILEEDMFKVLLCRRGAQLPPSFSVAPGLAAGKTMPQSKRMQPAGFTFPSFSCKQQGSSVTLATGLLRVTVQLPGFQLAWQLRTKGKWLPLFCDRPSQCYNFSGALGPGSLHYVQRHKQDLHFGLGEKTGNVVKTGGSWRMCNIDCMGYNAETSDPLYKHFPYYMVKAQNGFYALYYDTPEDCRLNLGQELDNYHGLYQYFKTKAEYLDYYVLAGHSMQAIVPRFAALGGRPCLPPLWGMGYLASSMAYTDAPNAQQMLQHFLQQCIDEDIPLSGFHLSSGYTLIGAKRYVFNWDTGRFPNPQALFAAYAKAGVKLIANIKPCLLASHPLYQQCSNKGLFVKNTAGGPQLSQFWDEEGSYLDFTNPNTAAWWQDMVRSQLLQYGIHATWNDNNEFEIWDENALCSGSGPQKQATRLRPVLTLQMLQASQLAQQAFAPGKRPFLISRAGCHGMQRFVQTWTGDNRTHWATLRYNHKMGLGLSLSGIFNFGHDVGGFAGPKPEAELFVRWVQHGIFMPRFSIHSWNEDGSVNEPWMYPQHTAQVRRLILLRYRLLPWLYTLLYQSHSQYSPIVCPVFYHFPQQQNYESDLYMLGQDMLVANVFDKGAVQADVTLPDATGWYNLWGGGFHPGGSRLQCKLPLCAPPAVFMREGSILPFACGVQGFASSGGSGLACRVFAPISGTATRSFFKDDGESTACLAGAYCMPTITVRATASQLVISVCNSGSLPLGAPLQLQVADALGRPVLLQAGGMPCTLQTGTSQLF